MTKIFVSRNRKGARKELKKQEKEFQLFRSARGKLIASYLKKLSLKYFQPPKRESSFPKIISC